MSLVVNESQFLETIWQKRSEVFRRCFDNLEALIHGDDLAGLACEDQVESRIITGSGINADWSCRQGPFEEDDFSTLDTKNWTLLVQGVDRWDADIQAVLEAFDFLPRWRLDDIMVSYAPIGGGVGPHFDNYDVFLIQACGARQWKIGQRCDAQTPLQDNDQVKLLAEFNCEYSVDLHARDMIYVPAGVAHWGTAISDDCITLSVGFRSPSEKQIMCQTLENLLQYYSADDQQESCFFRDTLLSIDKNPAKINVKAMQCVDELLADLTPELIKTESRRAFGQLVTEPRQFADTEQDVDWSVAEIQQRLKQFNGLQLSQPAHSRLAFSDEALFVNAQVYRVETSFSEMLCDLCISRQLSNEELELLVRLLNQGDIILHM